MFTGFFRDRARADASGSAEEQLQRLLHSPQLRPHHFHSHCEIGPFRVAHVCRERAVIVELQAQPSLRQSQSQRAAFLCGLGYTVLHIPVQDLRRRRGRVLRRIKGALRREGRQQ